MSNPKIFVIEYRVYGKPKSFIIRADSMSNADAWHWASCDMGAAPIPKPGRPPLKKFSKPMAEKFGVSEVRWRESAKIEWKEDQRS